MERQSRNTGYIVAIFAVTWNFWGGRTGITSKQQKMAAFSQELLSENDFETALATFCWYDYGVKAFEAVEKIATDQQCYHKCSICVIACCTTKAYHQ